MSVQQGIYRQFPHIVIHKNTNGDSRVAKKEPTIDEFRYANLEHIDDVNKIMEKVCDRLKIQAIQHDWTKVTEPYQTMFYNDLCKSVRGEMNFTDGEWAHQHYDINERHHLSKSSPDDVNMFDVMEMLCDCAVAGKARNEMDVYCPTVSDEVLQKAFRNTFDILVNAIEVKD